MPSPKQLHIRGRTPRAEDTPVGSKSDADQLSLAYAVIKTERYPADAQKASGLVQELLKEDAKFSAGCLKLCIHDAFAFDAKKRLYGVNASIR